MDGGCRVQWGISGVPLIAAKGVRARGGRQIDVRREALKLFLLFGYGVLFVCRGKHCRLWVGEPRDFSLYTRKNTPINELAARGEKNGRSTHRRGR